MSEVVEELEPVLEFVDEAAHDSPLKFILGGLFAGLAVGGAAGYFVARRMLETKYNEIAEDEIAEMRTYFRDKELALSNAVDKPALENLVKEKGYSAPDTSQPPMAVTPPNAVVERAEAAADAEPSDPRPPVPVVEREENVFNKEAPSPEELGVPEWNAELERSRRTTNRPYVVHIDEVHDDEEYDGVTYTYYEEDDVLCNEQDDVVAKDERDDLIGEANLNRFGHGSDDSHKVYIRNDRLSMIMEVILSPNSYAEEVHGFEPTPPRELRHQHRRERRSLDDE